MIRFSVAPGPGRNRRDLLNVAVICPRARPACCLCRRRATLARCLPPRRSCQSARWSSADARLAVALIAIAHRAGRGGSRLLAYRAWTIRVRLQSGSAVSTASG